MITGQSPVVGYPPTVTVGKSERSRLRDKLRERFIGLTITDVDLTLEGSTIIKFNDGGYLSISPAGQPKDEAEE